MTFDDTTVEQFTPMVAGIAWGYVRTIQRKTKSSDNTLHQDLMQEGYIGLMKACEQYQEQKGLFPTYAFNKIRRQIQLYLEYNNSLVHIPVARRREGFVCIALEIEGHELGVVNHEAEVRDEIRAMVGV